MPPVSAPCELLQERHRRRHVGQLAHSGGNSAGLLSVGLVAEDPGQGQHGIRSTIEGTLLYLDLLRTGGLWPELCEADPTDEAAHRELMQEYFHAGRLHAAIRQFQRLRTVLAREVGVLLSPQTLALYRQIIGTATSGWVRPGLVGREMELVRARATLRRAAEGRPAAIFVTGLAGIGKTRLCEELVELAVGDGWFVLRATGREQTESVPYWALVDAVQAVMVDRPYLANALPFILAGDNPAAIDTLGTVKSVPARLLGQLHVARGLASWCTGALDDAEEAGQQAKRLAKERGDLRDFVDATMVLAMVAHERRGGPSGCHSTCSTPRSAPTWRPS